MTLPTLPALTTETGEQIERMAERLMDRADKALLAGRATQAQYDDWCAQLYRWARRHH